MIENESQSFTGRLKVVVAGFALLAVLAFFVLLVIKLDSDARGESSGVDIAWYQIFSPLMFAFSLGVLWMMVNYCNQAPVTNVGSGGQGGQVYYNLMSQLLVRKLKYRSIENLNQSKVLRDFLNTAAYGLIIGYAFSAAHLTCKDCSVPYRMLSIGFLVAYALRLILSWYVGFYVYHRLLDMTDEVRIYQESMDEQRLFDQAIPWIHKTGVRTYTKFMDAFLLMVIVAFAVLGTIWVAGDTCKEKCPNTFHIYDYMLICIYFVEGAGLLVEFFFLYYERVAHIEALDKLCTAIELHNNKLELKAK